MSLIEGVGDEVVQFVVVLLVVVIASLAWWSTNARPDRYRTVLVMRSRPHHPVTVSILTRSNITNTQFNTSPPSTSESMATSTTSSDNENSRDSRVIPLQEMDSIVDADMAMLDNNRLHFYRRIDSPPNNQTVSETQSEEADNTEEQEPASNAQIREMDSIVSAMEADVTTGCDFFTRSSESHSTLKPQTKPNQKKEASTEQEIGDMERENVSGTSSDETDNNGDERKILIKLKYLNDTLKEVEGSLDELLKDFKRRHFSAELCEDRRVRLIFRGRVLGDEAATLRACGLHHHAVVHCLVHPSRAPRSAEQQQQHGPAEAPARAVSEAAPERAWDLENILMTLVSVALTVVWFFRCEYSNMFTASASVALFGLTVFYSVAIFGLYLSDTFHFDRRPAQPVPNN
ncbi:transmembrane and ubiquitin-like domain-containing protein 1 [Melitaea cinxia]|uniref:transmembrane and ubiquitin-like domain-containing protein 1 n=1 Tax=Melitaea cinxia TaxID=113334 RepID=UPI001E27347D|nr:transmembrane and ubiquitin-like domain-containing protein 1 [Melitaea cinxia]